MHRTFIVKLEKQIQTDKNQKKISNGTRMSEETQWREAYF